MRHLLLWEYKQSLATANLHTHTHTLSLFFSLHEHRYACVWRTSYIYKLSTVHFYVVLSNDLFWYSTLNRLKMREFTGQRTRDTCNGRILWLYTRRQRFSAYHTFYFTLHAFACTLNSILQSTCSCYSFYCLLVFFSLCLSAGWLVGLFVYLFVSSDIHAHSFDEENPILMRFNTCICKYYLASWD